jgi:hypothetical protein
MATASKPLDKPFTVQGPAHIIVEYVGDPSASSKVLEMFIEYPEIGPLWGGVQAFPCATLRSRIVDVLYIPPNCTASRACTVFQLALRSGCDELARAAFKRLQYEQPKFDDMYGRDVPGVFEARVERLFDTEEDRAAALDLRKPYNLPTLLCNMEVERLKKLDLSRGSLLLMQPFCSAESNKALAQISQAEVEMIKAGDIPAFIDAVNSANYIYHRHNKDLDQLLTTIVEHRQVMALNVLEELQEETFFGVPVEWRKQLIQEARVKLPRDSH